MSRHTFKHGSFELVVGVDHVTGTFIQVWNKNICKIVADNMGLSVREMIPEIRNEIGFIRDYYQVCKTQRIKHPNLAEELIVLVANRLGFPDLRVEIHNILN